MCCRIGIAQDNQDRSGVFGRILGRTVLFRHTGLWNGNLVSLGQDFPLVECMWLCPCIPFVSITLIFRRTQA